MYKVRIRDVFWHFVRLQFLMSVGAYLFFVFYNNQLVGVVTAFVMVGLGEAMFFYLDQIGFFEKLRNNARKE